MAQRVVGHSWGRPLFLLIAVVANVLVAGARRASAQEQGTVASGKGVDAPKINAEALLARPVTVRMDRVSLRQALTTVANRLNISIEYRIELLETAEHAVTIDAKAQPLGAVLDQLLAGTALHVVVTAPDAIALKPGEIVRLRNGGITGTVTDTKTQQPLRGVMITLDDATKGVRTDENGHYRVDGVAPGVHRLVARFVGYGRRTHSVTVIDSATVTVNIVLEPGVNTLNQVIVTATGAQRYRELGHTVTQLNVDSLVKDAPITSISELLTARVPGLQVLTSGGGTVGGDVALRLRGQTTAKLDPQPIVIVDGVRYKNTNAINSSGVSEDSRPFFAEQRSPLNDLNVNDVEKVEVVKGPSASTLYGPDAANGVIVITTKRGAPGKPRWHLYTSPSETAVPTDQGATVGYRAWGHDPNSGALYRGNCKLTDQAGPSPSCVLDSITVVPTVSQQSQFSVLAKNRPQWHSGASVSGGTPSLTYLLSGDYSSETGALQLSRFAEQFLRQQMGTTSLSQALKTPNTQQALSLHSNVVSQLNATSTVSLTASYTQANQTAINIDNLYGNTYQAGAIPPGVDTTDPNTISGYVPTSVFFRTTAEQVRRLTTSLSGTVQPTKWLTADALIGGDIGTSVDRGVEQADAEYVGFGGQVLDYRRSNTGRNASAHATATAHPGITTLRSSVGIDYSYTNLDGLNSSGYGLAPGSTSISTATSQSNSQVWSEMATLGGYGEEVVGFNDRLFLTGSLRLDGSTTFGDSYHPRPFPKIGASWIVSDEPFVKRLGVPGLDELRVRYSYGASSRYPSSAMKYGTIQAFSTTIEGSTRNVFNRDQLANPLLRPERTHEAEYGADATLASQVHLGLTWYARRTNDQLNTLTVPTSFLPQWANIGDVTNHGFEAVLGVTVFETQNVSFTLNSSYSHTINKLVNVGSAAIYQDATGSFFPGYPIDASFGQTVASVADTTGGQADGIITYNEVTLTPSHYLGVFSAPNTYTVNPVASLMGGHFRVSTLFDGQSGGVQLDRFSLNCGLSGLCIAPYLKTTPALQQAKFAACTLGCYIVSSNFTRWRELSVTTDLPEHFLRPVRLSRGSISAQVRNLALWTNYKGPDPESVPGFGMVGLNSAQHGASGIPLARAWTLRFDVYP